MAKGATRPGPGSGIEDAAEASQALVEITAAERELATIQAGLLTKVIELQTAADKQSMPLRGRIERLTARLESWAQHRLPERAGAIPLTTGRLGWQRLPPIVEIADEAALVRWLQAHRKTAFLAVSIDRRAILADPAAAATMPGVTIRPGGHVFVATVAAVPSAPRHVRHLQP